MGTWGDIQEHPAYKNKRTLIINMDRSIKYKFFRNSNLSLWLYRDEKKKRSLVEENEDLNNDLETINNVGIKAYLESDPDNFIGMVIWDRKKTKSGRIIPREFKSRFSFVLREYQRIGIATEMWNRLVGKYKPRAISILAVTDRGFTMANSFAKKFPDIKFYITDGGDRKLRILRKKN